MALSDDLRRIADAAIGYAVPGEELSAVIPTEPLRDRRVYLCAFTNGDSKSWVALDGDGSPVVDRRVLRDAVSIATICELAEEAAGDSDLPELRIASPAYLDDVAAATRQPEQAIGEHSRSPFAEAMKQAGLTIDGLSADIESHYKLELT